MGFFSSGGVWASLVAEHRLECARASVVAACELSSGASWALEHRLNSCDLVASRHVGSSRIRNGTHVSCNDRWILYP